MHSTTGSVRGFYVEVENYIKISGFLFDLTSNAQSIGIATFGGLGIATFNNILVGGLGGIYFDGGVNMAYQNFVYDSFMGISCNNNSSMIIKNNIVANSDYGFAGPSIYDYNLVWNNGSDYVDTSAGPHDISADPLFLDPVNGDFRLQAGSPAINAGVTLPEVTTDILGIPRPQGSAYDIGAYEYYDIPVTLNTETPVSYDNPSPTFTGTVSTVSTGTIVMIEYSIDGGEWTTDGVTPTDGAFDESEEEFIITLPYKLEEGEHTIQIRATDSYGNSTYPTMYADLEFNVELEEEVIEEEEEIEELAKTGESLLLHFVSAIMLTSLLIIINRRKDENLFQNNTLFSFTMWTFLICLS